MAKQVRRLNKRFVTFLTIGIMVVLTVAIGILIMATRHKDPQVYADRGDTCMVEGDYLLAAQNYMKAYKYSGNDPSWLIKASEAQYEQGDVKYALNALQLAVTADPNMVEARKRLVDMYWTLWGRSAAASLAKTVEDEADKLVKMIPEASAEKDPKQKEALALGYHVRGVMRGKRRAEDSSLERLAKEDIEKAISLDSKPDYVQSLATMSLENAQQMVRLAGSETISPEAFDTYIEKMDASIGEAEKVYLSLAKSAPDNSEAFVKLGDFYYQMWSRLGQAISGVCKLQGGRAENTIYGLNEQLAMLNQSKEVSVDDRRRKAQRLRNEISLVQRLIPEWKQRAERHEAKAKTCNARALEFYTQALVLAKDTESKVDARLALANYYVGNGQMAKAEPLAREAIQEDPQGYKAYRLFAMVMKQRAGESKEAREACTDEAIEMVSHRVNDLPHDLGGVKGRLNRYQRADLIAILVEYYLDRQQGDDLAKSDGMLKELETDAAENPILYQLKATRAIADKDYKTAVMLLEKADKLNSGRNPAVKLILAELYSRTGNLGAAKMAVAGGLALQPGSYSGLRLAMSIYLRLGESKMALWYAEQILHLPGHEKDTTALSVKLECLVRLDRMSEADTVAKELQLAGTALDWPVQKARLLVRQGKDTEAEPLLKEALAKDPGNKQATAYLVEVYSRQNDLEKARAVLKPALAKNPEDAGLKRLETLMSITDPKDRVAKMQELSQQMVDEAMDNQLAEAEDEKDPFKKAVMLFDQYVKRGEMDKARQYLDEAVKLDAEKANIVNFRYSLIQKDWQRARTCADLAKTKNLDSVDGLQYEAEFANVQGWDLLNAKKAEEAKKYFEASAKAAEGILRRLPNDSQARALLGEAYWWLDRRNEATIQIGKAMDLSPSNPFALRANCVMMWDAISTSGGAGGPEMVQTFAVNLRQASKLMPWDVWLKDKMEWFRTNLAKQREFQDDEKGDAVTVTARREKIRKENPKDVENLLRLAFVYESRQEVRDLDKAEACYQQCLNEQPSGNLVQLYVAYARRNQRMETAETFLKDLAVAEAKSGKGEGYTVLGYYYMMTRNLKQAESAFAEAVKVEDTAAKRLDMAVFYRQAGSVDKSVEWCRKALETKTDARQDRMVRSMLINSLLSLREWDQAKEHIDQFAKIYNRDPEGKIYEARLVLDQGKLSEAEGILTQVLAESPDYVEALDLRSMVYLYTWQLEKAQADLEKLKELNPRGFGLAGQIRLAKLYCEMAKTSEAERQARAVIEEARQQSGESLEVIRRDLLPSLSSSLEPRAYKDLLVWAANMYRGYWGWLFEQGRFEMLNLQYRPASDAYSQAWAAVAEAPVGLKSMILNAYMEALYKAKAYDELLALAEKVSKSKDFVGSTSQIGGWVSAVHYAKGESDKGFAAFRAVLGSEKNPLVIWQITRRTVLEAVKASALIGPLEELAGTSSKDQRNVRVALGSVYFAADQYDKGSAICRGLSASATDANGKALYLYLLGQEYTDKKQYPEAAKAFEEAEALQTNNLVAMNNLAYILEEYLGKAEEAEKVIGRAYAKAPNNPDLLDTYGQVLTKLGRQEEGLYNTAKSVWVQETATSRYHLGLILLAQNRRSDAGIQFRRALQLVGEDAELEKQIRSALERL
jgi:tetratricopeptide (TPR) repeat protein